MIVALIWMLPNRVREGIPEPPNLSDLTLQLTEIEAAADRAYDRVEQLDRRLEADAATDYRRSVVQTLIATLVGLLGGYSASWVDHGGTLFPHGALLRVAIFTAGGLFFVLIAPIYVFPRVDRLLIRISDFRKRH